MHGIAVALLTEDREQLVILQNRLESTHVARIVFSHLGFPGTPTDPIVRQMQDQRAEVVLVDVNPENPQRAIHAIELIRATTSDIAVFAVGEMRNPVTIVGAMRAGAGEFVDRMSGTDGLLEAFTRYASARSKTRSTGKARVFTVINAKGGSGATTLAVNTAVALQQNHGQTILVDFSPIGHEESVYDVLTVQPQGNCLAFLQGDLIRRKSESLCRDLDDSRTTIGIRLMSSHDRSSNEQHA